MTSKFLFSLVFFFSLLNECLPAVNPSLFYSGYPPGMQGFGRIGMYEIKKIKVDKIIQDIRRLNGELAVPGITAADRLAKENEIRVKEKELKDETSVNTGQLIARGIIGKDWEAIADANIEDWQDGIKKGFSMKTARAAGDVFDEKIRGTINHIFGGIWDWTLGLVLDSWDSMCSHFFHDSKEPFLESDLIGWRDFIIASIDDIERTIKDGVRDSTRGQDMTPRAKGTVKDDETVDEKTMWTVFVEVYVNQFYYFIDQIELHKQYYNEKHHHVEFYATQIKRRLEDLINLLINSRTIKEVDAKLESNKNMITAMKKNIKYLFERMIEDVKPRSYSVTKDSVTSRSKSSSSSSGRNNYSGSDIDNSFPMSHQSGYGSY